MLFVQNNKVLLMRASMVVFSHGSMESFWGVDEPLPVFATQLAKLVTQHTGFGSGGKVKIRYFFTGQ